jgi:hypothetical protein
MVELTKCIFYHIPKTGGSWVRAILKNNYTIVNSTGGHWDYDKYPKKEKKAFTFVRHPVGIFESSYHYERRVHECRIPRDEWVLSKFANLPFDEFVKNTVSEHPNWLGNYVKKFCGDMDYIGHQENLRNDLINILEIIDEPPRKNIVEMFPHVNVGNYKSLMTPELKVLIEQSEKWLIDTFYKGDYGVR